MNGVLSKGKTNHGHWTLPETPPPLWTKGSKKKTFGWI